ncbi:MAG: hypothetical protein ACFCD0_21615 [Gemmataceae bacterium]
MGIDLALTGRYDTNQYISPIDWLRAAQRWLQTNASNSIGGQGVGKNHEDHDTLFIASYIDMQTEFSIPQEGMVHFSGRTSSVGPGYHAHLVDLCKQLATDTGVTWEEINDETGYFETGHFQNVQENMLGWLGNLAAAVAERLDEDYQELRVCMGFNYSFPNEEGVLTPLGPRQTQWWKAVAENPRTGSDFFAWFEQGLGANYHLGRALWLMWNDIRWREPFDDDEKALWAQTYDALKKAYELDPTMELPWREWSELFDFVGSKDYDLWDTVGDRADDIDPDERLIGYRRSSVKAILPNGWTATILGETQERWEDDGRWFISDDYSHAGWITLLSAHEGNTITPEEGLADIEEPEDSLKDWYHEGENGLLGKAYLVKVEGEGSTFLCLHTYSAVTNHLARGRFCFADFSGLEWALEMWKGLEHPQSDD